MANGSFIEICIYEVKPDKVDEFEALIREVVVHHQRFEGTKSVRYMKRTHRPANFSDVKNGKPAIRLTRAPKSVTYALFWELDSSATHAKATRSGLKKFYKRFNRCLMSMPRIILGESLF